MSQFLAAATGEELLFACRSALNSNQHLFRLASGRLRSRDCRGKRSVRRLRIHTSPPTPPAGTSARRWGLLINPAKYEEEFAVARCVFVVVNRLAKIDTRLFRKRMLGVWLFEFKASGQAFRTVRHCYMLSKRVKVCSRCYAYHCNELCQNACSRYPGEYARRSINMW